MNAQTIEQDKSDEFYLEQLQVVETGWGPRVESTLLMDLLKRNLGFTDSQGDPTENQKDDNPLVSLNAYKHRLHALRCEYADARLLGIELDEQLAEANLRILRLEARVKHLGTTLEQIYASRFWKVKERCARCWRALSRWLSRRPHSSDEAAPVPNKSNPDECV